jgi:hypothetical protein
VRRGGGALIDIVHIFVFVRTPLLSVTLTKGGDAAVHSAALGVGECGRGLGERLKVVASTRGELVEEAVGASHVAQHGVRRELAARTLLLAQRARDGGAERGEHEHAVLARATEDVAARERHGIAHSREAHGASQEFAERIDLRVKRVSHATSRGERGRRWGREGLMMLMMEVGKRAKRAHF